MTGMKILLLLNIIFFYTIAFSQGFDKYDTLARNIPDSITQTPELFAKYLKENFNSDEKIVRALYVWLASNITYDFDKSDRMDSNKFVKDDEDLIGITLKNKKGICENYSAIFTKICDLCGIQSFIIKGYTRSFGQIQTKIGHVWNVAKIDSMWYLFDPTWGSGYERFERFHKKFTFEYYKANPDSFINTHMPLDPIWQLKDIPISHQDFIHSTSTNKILMNYCDSIDQYYSLPAYQRAITSFIRAENNGLNQPELAHFYKSFNNYSKFCLNNYYIEQYNNATYEYYRAIDAYKKYVSNIKKGIKNDVKLDDIIDMLNSSKTYLNNISDGIITQNNIDQLKNDIIKFKAQINSLKIKLKKK